MNSARRDRKRRSTGVCAALEALARNDRGDVFASEVSEDDAADLNSGAPSADLDIRALDVLAQLRHDSVGIVHRRGERLVIHQRSLGGLGFISGPGLELAAAKG